MTRPIVSLHISAMRFPSIAQEDMASLICILSARDKLEIKTRADCAAGCGSPVFKFPRDNYAEQGVSRDLLS